MNEEKRQLYKTWCERIAEARDTQDLLKHFREHVLKHYERYDDSKEANLKGWIVGIFNFLYILEAKYPYITIDDMLFKLCRHHKNCKDGPDAPFDVDLFIDEYRGDLNPTTPL